MNALKIKNDVIKMYEQLKKEDKLIDYIYDNLCNINLENEYDAKQVIDKIITKIEDLNEINFKEE